LGIRCEAVGRGVRGLMRCLVTGGRGFVGQHLVDLLRKQGNVVGTFDIKDGQDLRDYECVRKAIDDFRPDKIFHLGAVAYVPESFLDPRRAIETNTIGSLNVLDAVRNLGLKAKIHLCGTSEEYGDVEGENVQTTEHSLPNPQSPYSIGKLGMDYLGILYGKIYGMDIVVTRTFNHTGPGRGEMYAESAWAKQIVDIERGGRRVLKHGDLTTLRNYTDVRDIVWAYALAIDLPNGVYNICSDQNVTMGDVLAMLISKSTTAVPTVQDSHLIRPADFSFKAPSSDKFRRITGWEPTISLEDTLTDLLNYWRESRI
jgi:GDP-4-dehydro-6-deoxy-D-mannose reductase